MSLITSLASSAGVRLLALGLSVPTAAGLLSMMICRFNPQASAATRRLLWMLAFVIMAVSAPVALLGIQLAVPILPAPIAGPVAPVSIPPAPEESGDSAARRNPNEAPPLYPMPAARAISASPAPRSLAHATYRLPWQVLIPSLWACGFAALSLKSLAGVVRVRRVIQRSRSADDLSTSDLLPELSALITLPAKVRVLVSSDVAAPLVARCLRPALILPDAALQWPPQMLRMALLHELAHIEQNDVWSFAFARFVASFYWFNPMVWHGLRSLQAEAEMAADDRVVLADTQPIAYAECLVTLVRSLRDTDGSLFPAIGMARNHSIQARVERILDSSRPRLAPRRSVRLFALTGAALVSAGVLMVRPVAALPPSASAAPQNATGAGQQTPPSPMIALPPQELLFQAISEKDMAKAGKALAAGADPNLEGDYSHAGGYIGHSTPLYFAAEQGNEPFVRFLVEHGASVKPGKSPWTNAVDAALRNGFSGVVKYLREQGAPCDPLAYAAATGDLDAVKQLAATANAKSITEAAMTAAGCGQVAILQELHAKNGDPMKAFYRATSDGSVEAMQFFLDHGVNLKDAGAEALRKAADKGQARSVAFLLKAGVKPDPEKPSSYTPLHFAARYGSLESVKLLLDAGADPNSLSHDENNQGSTPLFSISESDNAEIGRLLLDRGARMDIFNKWGRNPVIHAAASHAPQVLALFIDRGADLKVVDTAKRGLMQWAVSFAGENYTSPPFLNQRAHAMARISRETETVRVLLDKGMDVNTPAEDGSTPLSIAISRGQTACMEMLLQRGANVNAIDRRGGTPLIRVLWAMVKEEWRLAVVEKLFAHGADPNIGIDNPVAEDDTTTSALKAAITHGPDAQTHRNLARILLAHGARFSVEKNSDIEKMLIAATTGDLTTVQSLLAKGVSPNVADTKGWTPLLSASGQYDSAVLHALVNAGADVNARDVRGSDALGFWLGTYPDLTEFHWLLDKGADPEGGNKSFHSAPRVLFAIQHDDPALTLELLKRGATPNLFPTNNPNIVSPLESAVDLLEREPNNEKRREIVKTLLQFGANPHHKDLNHRSVLFSPVTNGHVDLVKFLLGAGIDPRKDDDGGKQLSEQAERSGAAEMKALIKAALEKDPKPNADESPRTPVRS